MKEVLTDLLLAVITAAIPVLTTYAVMYIQKAKEKAVASTEDTVTRGILTQIADAVAKAVSMTSQTYVDSLKAAGTFDLNAQKEAFHKALEACILSLAPAARDYITTNFGDLESYLTTRIEAEVRAQKVFVIAPMEGVAHG